MVLVQAGGKNRQLWVRIVGGQISEDMQPTNTSTNDVAVQTQKVASMLEMISCEESLVYGWFQTMYKFNNSYCAICYIPVEFCTFCA